MSENKDSCPIKFHTTPPSREERKPGDLWCDSEVLRDDYADAEHCCVYMVFPDGSESGGIMVYRTEKPALDYPAWQMTGKPDAPETFSLHPSLHLRGRWHGWLKNGWLKSC